ncbi:hypothetical protein PS627_03150 [Pseudomonas fluorescens]|nr:hypothetical protein PS627_03150 [Pseudomonas fluorescens]VVP68376.1 hypothetical protein PS910_00359 [Pseudomonas fluorescens]
MHERGYRSGTINTDALGFRYSYLAGKRFSVAERGRSARVNLLVGGSTALGIGASSDANTVASCLSMLTGEVWLSLAGCGHNATQELMMFLDHQHRFGQIGQVVVLSGLNTLAHEALSDAMAGEPHPQRARAYQDFLNTFNEGLHPFEQERPESLMQRLRQALVPSRGTCPALAIEPLSAPDKRLTRAADSIARTLLQWQRLLADSHASLTFILQPLLPWCRETPLPGEQDMLKNLDAHPSNFDRLLSGVLDNQLHAAFFQRIRNQCDPVDCHDMNSMLSSSPVFGESLFVDRLHFNDLGNNALAKVITAKLGLAHQKYLNPKATSIRLVTD